MGTNRTKKMILSTTLSVFCRHCYTPESLRISMRTGQGLVSRLHRLLVHGRSRVRLQTDGYAKFMTNGLQTGASSCA